MFPSSSEGLEWVKIAKKVYVRNYQSTLTGSRLDLNFLTSHTITYLYSCMFITFEISVHTPLGWKSLHFIVLPFSSQDWAMHALIKLQI